MANLAKVSLDTISSTMVYLVKVNLTMVSLAKINLD
jgi:hypothetical protein